MQLIKGKIIANQILNKAKSQWSNVNCPKLAVIMVGADPASTLYVSIKEARASELGIGFKKFTYSKNVEEKKIINKIKKLNADDSVTAILVQLPLPKHLNSDNIISVINPAKDADGIHPDHLKMLEKGQTPPVLPATTAAIDEIIKSTNINLKEKSVAIIGKSRIVGLPTYHYLKDKVKSIEIYDHSTKNIPDKSSRADILIVAIGCPHFITEKYIKKNALIIDVGINRIAGKTIGDVDPKSVENKATFLTPVPGGIGPITVACLLYNTVTLTK